MKRKNKKGGGVGHFSFFNTHKNNTRNFGLLSERERVRESRKEKEGYSSTVKWALTVTGTGRARLRGTYFIPKMLKSIGLLYGRTTAYMTWKISHQKTLAGAVPHTMPSSKISNVDWLADEWFPQCHHFTISSFQISNFETFFCNLDRVRFSGWEGRMEEAVAVNCNGNGYGFPGQYRTALSAAYCTAFSCPVLFTSYE